MTDHFAGKSVIDHLREARTRGALAAAEVHGTEMPGHLSAAADAAKGSSISLLLLWAIGHLVFTENQTLLLLLSFSCGLVLWKTARSSLLGWARMERLHRLIEEERWEIEHHRHQEKEELTEMYQAKGFNLPLLEEVVDHLMADDNRLLKVMLEEELGLTLEAYEHPLKQACGAAAGTLCTTALMLLAFLASPSVGLPLSGALLLAVASSIAAKLERNHIVHAIIWNLATATLATGSVYFLTQAFHGALSP